jgi:protein-L-isoaspartate O-methyltransferase
MVDAMKAAGYLSPTWEAVFRAVPRHAFVRDFDIHVVDGQPTRHVAMDSERWLQDVYTDEALITLREEQHYLSSSSMPSRMARFLALLDVQDGNSTLEVGTGTGYNAALLSERLGAECITSVDLDPELVVAARAALQGCGYRPTLAPADGYQGYPARAPYDRIIATCSVPRIPPPWLEQLGPSGVIVAPFTTGMLVGLHRQPNGSLVGRADPDGAGFMRLRSSQWPPEPDWVPFAEVAERRPIEQPVEWLFDYLVRFFAGLHAHDLEFAIEDGNWSLASRLDGSWARTVRDEDGSCLLTHGGPRRLWDEYETAAQEWVDLGRPSWDRYGMTITPDRRHTVWLDRPDSVHAWEV